MIVVVLVLLALAAGTAVGYACGGRLRHLAERPPVRSRLILTALGVYVVGVAGSWAWEPLLPVLSAGCWLVLAFYAWLNRERDGARLIALGLACNALVILLNGAMPMSASAEARAGAERVERTLAQTTTLDDSTVLPWLGKVVPVAFPLRPEVVSPGDIAVAAGAAVVVAGGMTRRRAPADRRGLSTARRTAPDDRDSTSTDDDAVPTGSQPGDEFTEAEPGRERMASDVDTESASPRASA